MINRLLTRWRLGAALAAVLLLHACGGGGGGGSGGGSPPTGGAYSNVQPPAAPAAEVVNPARASGTVSVSPDPFDPAGRRGGVPLELNEVLPSGALGPSAGSAVTAADGSFSIALPAGAAASDGKWLVSASPAAGTLRAYVHPGAMRVDVGSEAWVRQVQASAGRLVVFPGAAAGTMKAIVRSLALYADVSGTELAGLALDAAADRIVESLQRDHAMAFVRSTLAGGGALPTQGVGDIGGFSALTHSYAAEFGGGAGAHVFVTFRSQFGTPMTTDGSWTYTQANSTKVNGQLTPIAGTGGVFRATPARLFGRLIIASAEGVALSNAVGEFAQRSFPLQSGDRQLDARRINQTGLNFTGGSDEQPISFSSIERVFGVESIDSAAGPVRAVKVVSEIEIGIPTSASGVSRLTVRSTSWHTLGAGVVRTLEQALIDGAGDPSLPDESLSLVEAWANDEVWPHRVSFQRNLTAALRDARRCATAVPGTRRVVSVESGPVRNGSPTLALASWDIDTAEQVGATRIFQGYSSGCPVAAGQSGSVLVTEAFLDLQQAGAWPADPASAAAASDVVHQVSALDLQDISSHTMPTLADALQPGSYWPGIARHVAPAPDASGTFLAAITRYDSVDWTRNPLLVQIRGPGAAGPLVDLGKVQVALADWRSGQLFTKEIVTPFTLRVTPFSAGAGADAAGTRTLRTDFRDVTAWQASASLLFLSDGRSLRIADGAAGPLLGFDSDKCGGGAGELLCLDWANDRLVRFDPASGVQRSVVPLGSFLRRQSNRAPDYSSPVSILSGIGVQDGTTFTVGDYDVHIGRW